MHSQAILDADRTGASVSSSVHRSPQRSLTSPHFRVTPKLPGPRQHVLSIPKKEPHGHGPAQKLVPLVPASSSLERERTESQGVWRAGGQGSPTRVLPFYLTQNPVQQRRPRPGEGKGTQGHMVYTRALPRPTEFSLQSVQNSSCCLFSFLFFLPFLSFLSFPFSLSLLFQILLSCA